MKKVHTYLFQFIVLTGVYYGLELLFNWNGEYHWQNLITESGFFGIIMMSFNIYSDYRKWQKLKEKNLEYWKTYDKVVTNKDNIKNNKKK
ncbi:hypothetical protein ETF27_10280 [Prevotella brunnea]|uniref:Uncharacterized protein n=1 Tax=Prevotella brunnea TaxID=2508867 RepID=A0A5C8GAI9_9BACT|nr:hypothetical protein [Prevotella brunnea]MDR0186734.1 hypothetical protein [Prevotella brunnea]TXJ58810.1 hypothetical protein ETF27_10280 [Prevotella brunnea]